MAEQIDTGILGSVVKEIFDVLEAIEFMMLFPKLFKTVGSYVQRLFPGRKKLMVEFKDAVIILVVHGGEGRRLAPGKFAHQRILINM